MQQQATSSAHSRKAWPSRWLLAPWRSSRRVGDLPSLRVTMACCSVSPARSSLLIARTQVSKSSTALTRARSEELNLPWYIWRGSLDQRERLSRPKMEDILFDSTLLPREMLVGLKSQGHYNAGDIYNCRCMQTLVRFDQVSWLI